MLQPANFFDFKDFEHQEIFESVEYVWEVLRRLEDYLKQALKPGINGKVAPNVVIADNVFIGEGTVVEPGAYIMGPTIIGRDCQIRQGAYLRGNVMVGDGGVVGHCTEVKHSILLPGAGAPHFNYVGDSIIGRKANLGAGSILSNFKLTGDNVIVNIEGQNIRTGLRKFGGIIGDGTQIGCNAVMNPGTLLGPDCIVYPCASVRGYHPGKSIIRPK
jgi:NDP-sugar pyrophosphorylase family protein